MSKLKNDNYLLQTRDLAVGYASGGGEKKIQEQINISVKPGEVAGMLGQNGVGKSTIIKTVSGLLPALKGDVILFGRDIRDYTAPEMARIMSLVLTDRVSAGNLTVKELVALGRHPYTGWLGRFSREDRDKIYWAIDATRINYIADKKVGELSDGQRQKAMIARALAQDGQLMLLDEPTAHLDLNNRLEIMGLLKELSETTGKAVVVSTHELDLVMQIADRLWLINFDKPLISGFPEDLAIDGHLQETFFLHNFHFDLNTGKFRQRRTYHRQVMLTGPRLAGYWTRHALERHGIGISPDSETKVTVLKVENETRWKLEQKAKDRTFSSLIDLITYMSGQF